ncbi:unnamed protein product [Bursaphelenchus xylophilus]|uniref:(pine wood nematode) hypothetical protein n=1 Tax=Bursaphelenchus xylophilus TaxID=6326 RepID=A0A7I8X6A3_BURXY|nr:unnamed protein product [Bursaphelenchus xylophilus]CAG9123232.1 unnamed protein product [Bursaphelenchus xylophilus]
MILHMLDEIPDIFRYDGRRLTMWDQSHNPVEEFMKTIGCVYDDKKPWDCQKIKSKVQRTVHPILTHHTVHCTEPLTQTMTKIPKEGISHLVWSDWSPCMVDGRKYRFRILPFNVYFENNPALFKKLYQGKRC